MALLMLFGLLAGQLTLCLAQSTLAVRINASTPLAEAAQLPSAETLGAGDLIDVAVSYCAELSRTFRVTSEGTLALPLLHHPLPVAGLTSHQVAESLTAALLKEQLLADPVVTVSVLECHSRPVSIVGAVNHPINFQATDRTTLVEALAKAGGLSPTAGSDIIVTTEATAAHGVLVRIVAVKDLIGGKIPQANLALRGGEEVRIPEANKIFVAGNVRRPGAFPMQNDSDTTVMKAVALSSGLETYSGNVAYIYRKREIGVERDEVQIPLRKIMTRQSPDVVLMADDILYVPTAEGKKLTAKILGQLAGFGQTAEAGLLVVR